MIDKFEGRWRFLSNFYPCQIEHQGIKYPSVEHYYVAMKCNNEQMINGRHYTTIDFREMISKIPSAAVVKTIGQKMRVRKDWEEKKTEFMNWVVREKFKDASLRQMLQDTDGQPIVESNYWHDNFWGQCLCGKCSNKGKNTLGKILMEVRNEIKGEKRPDSVGDFLKKD